MASAEILQWLEGLRIGVWIRESLWGFPVAVGIHILALTLSVGILVWFDLRLLGVSMRPIPVSTVYRRLMPWAFCGFALMFASGGSLFAAYATAAYPNVYFRVKMTALLLAGINAGVYHLVTERGIAEWDKSARPPLTVRIAGLVSIVLWATIIVCGRMMSYTIF
jgi:hypothetical protein